MPWFHWMTKQPSNVITLPKRESMNEEHNDLPLEDIIAQMNEVIPDGHICFLKWTCPGCDERVTASDPNTAYRAGAKHTERDDGSECGWIYDGSNGWGLLIIFQFPRGAIQ